MPPKKNFRGGKRFKYGNSGPMSQNMGTGFYPSNFMAGEWMSPYMQAALGVHGASSMFGMEVKRPRKAFRRNYQSQLDYPYPGSYYDQDFYQSYPMQNPYFRISDRRFYDSGFRGRNNRFRRNKRPNAQAGGDRGKAKKAKTTNPESVADATAEEEGNEDGGKNESSDRGAKAPSKDWKNSNDSQTRFCTVCETDFVGSFFNHRRNLDHRRNKDKKYPRCRLCRKTFSGSEEFEAHNKTAEHNKMNEDFQVLKQQQVVHASLSDSEDEQNALQSYMNKQEPDEISDTNAEPVGLSQIVPIKVYFCKLCQKIFPSYMKGRHVHCRTSGHIQAYKVYFDEKEERAAERNRLQQEKKKKGSAAAKEVQSNMETEAEEKGKGEDVEEDEQVMEEDQEDAEPVQKDEDELVQEFEEELLQDETNETGDKDAAEVYNAEDEQQTEERDWGQEY